VSLGKTLNAISHLWAKRSTRCGGWWPSLTKDMQTEQLLCGSGMTDTEHSTIFGSTEEDQFLK